MLRFLALFLITLFALPGLASDRVLVFAAASQRDAMMEIGRLYEQDCACKVVFSFAATSTLARQLDAGGPADAFISANEAWVDWLEIRGAVNPDSRSVVAGNRLVIASAQPTRDSFNILFRGRFAMADPVSVPAGIYAREALGSMGIWKEAKSNAVYAENVRVALSSIRRGDLMSGIVYQSDLRLVPELHAHFVFPQETHQPIHYVAVATKTGSAGEAFVDFLATEEVQEQFSRFGFLRRSDTN